MSRLRGLLDLRWRLERAIAEMVGDVALFRSTYPSSTVHTDNEIQDAAREALDEALAAAPAAPVVVAASPSPPQQVAQGAPAPAALASPQSAPALAPVPAPVEEEDGGVLLDDEGGVSLDA